ncbi:hypothetical protein VHARVF571_570034 [Vibrio harveyi]|nr:hypothetical protein VHARVF571_570034 [Vibrio harveyi]
MCLQVLPKFLLYFPLIYFYSILIHCGYIPFLTHINKSFGFKLLFLCCIFYLSLQVSVFINFRC